MLTAELDSAEFEGAARAATTEEHADVKELLALARELALDRRGLLELRTAHLAADEEREE